MQKSSECPSQCLRLSHYSQRFLVQMFPLWSCFQWKSKICMGFLFLVLALPGTCLSISHLWYRDIIDPGLIFAATVDCNSRKKKKKSRVFFIWLQYKFSSTVQTTWQKMGLPGTLLLRQHPWPVLWIQHLQWKVLCDSPNLLKDEVHMGEVARNDIQCGLRSNGESWMKVASTKVELLLLQTFWKWSVCSSPRLWFRNSLI